MRWTLLLVGCVWLAPPVLKAAEDATPGLAVTPAVDPGVPAAETPRDADSLTPPRPACESAAGVSAAKAGASSTEEAGRALPENAKASQPAGASRGLLKVTIRFLLVLAYLPAWLVGWTLVAGSAFYAFLSVLNRPLSMITFGSDGFHGNLAPPFLVGLLGAGILAWAFTGTLVALGFVATG